MAAVRFLASARSNFNWRWSHVSALPPNTRSSRMAISGEIPDLPVNKLESACRLTPKTSAPAVTDRPLRSRHSCRTSAPGCCSLTDITNPPSPSLGCAMVKRQATLVNVLRARKQTSPDDSPSSRRTLAYEPDGFATNSPQAQNGHGGQWRISAGFRG